MTTDATGDRFLVIQSCDGRFLWDWDNNEVFEERGDLAQLQGSVENSGEDESQLISTGFEAGGRYTVLGNSWSSGLYSYTITCQ